MQEPILGSLGEKEWEGWTRQYPCYKGAHTLVERWSKNTSDSNLDISVCVHSFVQ